MNDELEQLTGQSPQAKPPSKDSRLAGRSGLQDGQPLQAEQPPEGGPRAALGLSSATATAAKDPAHAAAGPHRTTCGKKNKRPSRSAGNCAPTELGTADPNRAKVKMGNQLLAVGLSKSYQKGKIEVPVLTGVNLGVREGEFLAIVGQSGSGKSTLLHLLGTLDAPDAGEIHFDGRRIDNQSASARDALRNRRLGMIFQFYHLLPELTTLENVLAPLMITHNMLSYFRHRRHHQAAAVELLEMVGLGHRLKHKPRELSGGEMQRAAIARALIAGPDLLLADEPTGNLDHGSGQEIMKILETLNRQQDLTIVMVTHDQAIAQRADRIVRLVDGRIDA